MTRQQDNEGLIHHRPADWDEKYGPYGTPPDYTPPMTATNNVQSPLGLRIGGVLFAVFFVGFLALGYTFLASGEPISGQIIFMLVVLLVLSSYMTWWCFHLAKRRSKWLREKAATANNQTTEG